MMTTILQLAILITGYLLTFSLTTYLIRKIIFKGKPDDFDIDRDGQSDEQDKRLINEGYIIGKCENIIILSFVIAGEITGLALIFAAKNIVRKEKIDANAAYFLAGTMINFTASLLMGYLIKIALTHV